MIHNDKFHLASSFLSKEQLSNGKIFNIVGGDKVERLLLQVEGQVDNVSGVFEYILENTGKVSHQIFKLGGIINGIPN